MHSILRTARHHGLCVRMVHLELPGHQKAKSGLFLFPIENQCDNIVLLLDSQVDRTWIGTTTHQFLKTGVRLYLIWGCVFLSITLLWERHSYPPSQSQGLIVTIVSWLRSALLQVFFLHPDMPLGEAGSFSSVNRVCIFRPLPLLFQIILSLWNRSLCNMNFVVFDKKLKVPRNCDHATIIA